MLSQDLAAYPQQSVHMLLGELSEMPSPLAQRSCDLQKPPIDSAVWTWFLHQAGVGFTRYNKRGDVQRAYKRVTTGPSYALLMLNLSTSQGLNNLRDAAYSPASIKRASSHHRQRVRSAKALLTPSSNRTKTGLFTWSASRNPALHHRRCRTTAK